MNKFERQFKNSLKKSNFLIHEEHLKQTILLSRQEFIKKFDYERINFFTFLFLQIKYIGKRIWLTQGLILTALCGVLNSLYDGAYVKNQRSVCFILCILSILTLMTVFPIIMRAIKYKMQEIEMATRFSMARILVAKLIIIAMGNMAMLLGIFLITALKTSLDLTNILLYLILPFLIGSSGYLYVIGHIPMSKFPVCYAIMSVLIFSAIILLRQYCPDFFYQSFSLNWLSGCVGLIIFCIYQFRYILYNSHFGETQLV